MRTGLNILIVDDSDLIAERMIARLATLPGVGSVTRVATLASAHTALESTSPDVVILDIQLRDGLTTELYDSIKERLEVPRVIVFTNYPFESHRRKFLASGADYFFDKSADFEKLIGVVSSLVPEVLHA